jgi:hypothetical protein
MSAADARDLATLDWPGSCAERGSDEARVFRAELQRTGRALPTMRAPTSAED